METIISAVVAGDEEAGLIIYWTAPSASALTAFCLTDEGLPVPYVTLTGASHLCLDLDLLHYIWNCQNNGSKEEWGE